MPLLREVAKRDEVQKFLILLTRLFQTGTVPGIQLLTLSRLVALDKPDGGVRPIAVSEILYRLIAKVALRRSFKPEQLAPFQLGVQSPGGVEPIIHLLHDFYNGDLQGYNHVLSLDFKNAFNALRRRNISAGILRHAPEFFKLARLSYGTPTALIMYDGTVIQSAEGVRQGDPLGPLFFSLGIRDTLQGLRDTIQQTQPRDQPPILVAYLDDVYIFTNREVSTSQVQGMLSQAPIQLNAQKTSHYSRRDIQEDGIHALGSYIGPRGGTNDFLEKKVQELHKTIIRIQDLPKQHQLLLLKASTTTLLRHLLRVIPPSRCRRFFQQVDQASLESIRALKAPHEERETDFDLTVLPSRLGGLGITPHLDLSPLAFQASQRASREVLRPIIPIQAQGRLYEPFQDPEASTQAGADMEWTQDAQGEVEATGSDGGSPASAATAASSEGSDAPAAGVDSTPVCTATTGNTPSQPREGPVASSDDGEATMPPGEEVTMPATLEAEMDVDANDDIVPSRRPTPSPELPPGDRQGAGTARTLAPPPPGGYGLRNEKRTVATPWKHPPFTGGTSSFGPLYFQDSTPPPPGATGLKSKNGRRLPPGNAPHSGGVGQISGPFIFQTPPGPPGATRALGDKRRRLPPGNTPHLQGVRQISGLPSSRHAPPPSDCITVASRRKADQNEQTALRQTLIFGAALPPTPAARATKDKGPGIQATTRQAIRDLATARTQLPLPPITDRPVAAIKAAYQAAVKVIHEGRRTRLAQRLDTQRQRSLEENQAYLARKWLDTLPTTKALLLADIDIAGGLAIRMLTPLSKENSEEGLCKDCGIPWHFGHDDICKAKFRQTIIKHDIVCNALAKALRTVPGNTVSTETQDRVDSQKRTDIKIDSSKGTQFFDITIVSLAATTAQSTVRGTLTNTEIDKQRKYKALGSSFYPIVFSQGGMLGERSSTAYKSIQQALSYSGALFLDQYLSVHLVRIRARTWEGYGLS